MGFWHLLLPVGALQFRVIIMVMMMMIIIIIIKIIVK